MRQKRYRILASAGVCLLCSMTLLCRAAGPETYGIQGETQQERMLKEGETGLLARTEEEQSVQTEPESWMQSGKETQDVPDTLKAEGTAPQETEGGDAAEAEGTAPPEAEGILLPETEENVPEEGELPDLTETEEIVLPETERPDFTETEGEKETEARIPETQCIRKMIRHRHTGTTEQGGGCHGSRREWTTTETKRCNNRLRPSGGSEKGKGVCDVCGGYSSRSSGVCGRVKESKTVTHVAYDRNCGRTEDTAVAELTLSWDTQEWSRQVQLQGSYRILEGSASVRPEPFLWNEETVSADGILTAGVNGRYTLELQMDANSNTQDARISYTVGNIDHTAPVIRRIDWEKENFVKEAVVTVTAEDLQPEEERMDGNPQGCGLHQLAYSFDGGETWQEDNKRSLKNGVYRVAVRDRLGNTAAQEIVIDNVDDRGPEILEISKDPSSWTRKDVNVTVTAQDLQPDRPGREGEKTIPGSGLHETAFSFDGGHTFRADGSCRVRENETLELVVRDRLGNETRRKIEIANIDREKPHISVKQKPEHWTGGVLELQIQAHDEESGLPDRPFSWDEGTSWTDKTKREVTEAGYYKVLVKDRAGNLNYEELLIRMEEEETVEEETGTIEAEHAVPAEPEPPQRPRSPVVPKEQPETLQETEQVELPEIKAAGPERPRSTAAQPEILEQEKRSLPFVVKLLLILSALLVLLAALLILIWLLCFRVRVYVRGEREAFSLVMTGWIVRRQNMYCFGIPKGRIGRTDYTHMKLVLTRFFAAARKEKQLKLNVEGVEAVLSIEREIHLP